MDEDSDTATLMFSITIDATDSIPAFAGGATIEAQTFTIGTAVDLTLPAATGGNGASTYTLTPALPAGLTLDAATGVLTGTPTTVAGATMHTYTAGDTDGSAAGTDEVSLMFSITVELNTAPAFAADAAIADQAYIQDEMITPVTLPAATGGNGAIAYTLTPHLPTGLTFDEHRDHLRHAHHRLQWDLYLHGGRHGRQRTRHRRGLADLHYCGCDGHPPDLRRRERRSPDLRGNHRD